ncbi:unnamed protein product [Brachionus calyciflorus]|uniref:Uncharacterized protein n=1 Tax=Brachionus calyciflorus TaxID=104777 RepID=A0A814GZ22_9BILA|nr:unnamed protein product [Brachionus calyciflorus]
MNDLEKLITSKTSNLKSIRIDLMPTQDYIKTLGQKIQEKTFDVKEWSKAISEILEAQKAYSNNLIGNIKVLLNSLEKD